MSENLNKSVCMNSEDRKMKIESLKTEQENIKNKINLIQSTANEQINQLKLRLNNETFWLMITSAFTPLPFKIFCISAGLAKVNFIPFLLGSIIGRGLRFLIVGMLAYKYGTKFEEILKSKKIVYLMIGLISFLIIYLYYKWK